MKMAQNTLVLKIAPSPKSLSEIRELRVEAGQEYIMAFDGTRCVGVVFEHNENRLNPANHQAEICFFDEFYSEFGKWHRIFLGGKKGERLTYKRLQALLAANKEFRYIAQIK